MSILRKLAAVAAIAIAALGLALGAAGPASAADIAGPSAHAGILAPSGQVAADTAVSHLAGNAVQPLASVHSCKVAGNDGTTQGVFCADVVDEGGGIFYVEAEAYCQNLSNHSYPPCADINFGFEGASTLSQGAFWVISPNPTHFCGHTAGACPTGRRVAYSPTYSACDEVWTVVLSGARIQLPGSDQVVTLSANFASAHTTVC